MGSCRVLVVDDNSDVRESLVMILELLGHRALAIDSGARALDALRDVHRTPDAFQLAILDVGMPTMSGYDLAAAMRREVTDDTLTIVAFTGRVSAADRARAMDAGFDAYLTKPVDMQILRELLQRVGSKP